MEQLRHPRVLCVDDEPRVLDGISRHLRHRFAVSTANGAEAALETIATAGPFVVVVSDLKMPGGMDGVALLRRVRELAPDTVRILLTGQADLNDAIAAVNEGHIFRFLSKPCPPDSLLAALDAAAEQHRLITSERVLLEQTLLGSIKALTEVLALANPAAFGRATRAKERVGRLAAGMSVPDAWQSEIAAMLSQIGCVTLPPETAERLYHGRPLDPAERAATDRLPMVAEKLLANIPRIETVRAIVRQQGKHFDGTGQPADGTRGEQVPWGARALKIVLDFDVLESQGAPTELALDTLRGRQGWYDPAILQAFAEQLGNVSAAHEVREIRLKDVTSGMVFAEDVVARTGMLLIARGLEVTPALVERIRHFPETTGVREPVRVIVPVAVKEADDADRASG